MLARTRGIYSNDDDAGGQAGSTWWRAPGSEVSFGTADTIPGDTSTTASVAVGGFVTAQISPGNDTDWFSLDVVAGQTYLVSLRGSGSDPIEDPLLILHDNLGATLTQDDDGGSGTNSLLTFTATYTGAYFVEARTFGQLEAPGEYRIDLRQQGADSVPDTIGGAVALDLGEVTFGFIEDGFDTVYTDAGEVDRYKFEVEVGKMYTIEVTGGADYDSDWSLLPPGELDTQIKIYDSGFGVVTSNDDIDAEDIGSRVSFIAQTSGTYYLDVYSWQEWTGGYSITSSVKSPDPLDAIDWGTQLADNAVTVYFAESGEIFGGETSDGWFPTEIQQAMAALAVYSTFSDLTFAITDDQASATFTLVAANLSGGTDGYFGPPGETNEGVGALDVFSPYWSASGALDQGGYFFFVMLHEFGHGLGLAHPQDDGGTSEVMLGVTAPRGSYGLFDLNQSVYTVMSYNDSWPLHPDGPTPFSVATVGSGWSGTPGAFDIALIQQKYGAVAHNVGSNTYFLPTANAAGAFYACIWDTGGIDEIVQNGAVACRIDLTAATLDYSPTGGGVVSYVDHVYGGFTIANGVVIENAGGGSGNDVLIGNEAANILAGNGGADVIQGRAGDDTLNGGAGPDTMTGGAGNDTYVVGDVGDSVVEGSSGGTDTVQSLLASLTLAANVENLTLIGAAISGTGNALNNNLSGNSLANTLNGAAGADTMSGGGGDDIYYVENAGDQVLEPGAADGFDTVNSSIAFTLGANIEKLVLLGTGAIDGNGNGLANILLGNSGANQLDGGGGNDQMRGGAGNDTYFVDSVGDKIFEISPANGVDTVMSSVSFGLSAYVENLTLTGGALNASGNTLANNLVGNASANVLNGGGGGDTMTGGGGNDTYYVDIAGDQVIETNAADGFDTVVSAIGYALGAHVERLTLAGTAMINATGNGLDNVLVGNGAANQLDGGAGADQMRGGGGSDTYFVDSVGDQIFEIDPAHGIDQVSSAVSFGLSAYVENLTLTGAGSIDGNGNTLANILIGNGGNNLLNGGGGADTMAGGAGDDTYVVDDAGDSITEGVGAGMDLVKSAITFSLGASVDNLTLTGAAAIGGTGNNLANLMTGNGAANALSGGLGNDTLQGVGGNDTLKGGGGNDTLQGGANLDSFVFDTALNASTNVDQILDFGHGVDKIVLDDAVFAALAPGALPAGAFVLGAVALDAGDHILYDAVTGILRYDPDGNGAAAAIHFATLTTHPANLAASDFLVI